MRLCILVALSVIALQSQPVFNVKDYGATGHKQDDARPALQRAIDECGRAGGGTVYVPPGEYTSGQLRLRSGVRLYVEAGATLFASLDGRQFDSGMKAALIYGEDLHDIAIEGRGAVDGQGSYIWQLNDFTDYYIRPNQLLMEATHKPLLRAFPAGWRKETVYPRLVLLLRCNDVAIRGLTFRDSRSWTINPYACKRLTMGSTSPRVRRPACGPMASIRMAARTCIFPIRPLKPVTMHWSFIPPRSGVRRCRRKT